MAKHQIYTTAGVIYLMTNNNLYVILPIEMFASKKDEYTAKANWDKGSARYNLAGTKVLVEESPGGNGLPYN